MCKNIFYKNSIIKMKLTFVLLYIIILGNWIVCYNNYLASMLARHLMFLSRNHQLSAHLLNYISFILFLPFTTPASLSVDIHIISLAKWNGCKHEHGCDIYQLNPNGCCIHLARRFSPIGQPILYPTWHNTEKIKICRQYIQL